MYRLYRASSEEDLYCAVITKPIGHDGCAEIEVHNFVKTLKIHEAVERGWLDYWSMAVNASATVIQGIYLMWIS